MRSKRTLAVLAVAMVLVGCGDGGTSTQDALEARLRADAVEAGRDPTEEGVRCAATAVLNVLGEQQVRDALDAGGDAFDERMAQELQDPAVAVGFFDELERCSGGYELPVPGEVPEGTVGGG